MFATRDGELWCEDVACSAIAAAVGTPTYIYSSQRITDAVRAYQAAFRGARPVRFHYSVKANSSMAVLALIARLGMGADIVSGGELVRWLRAGGRAEDVVFSGVGKTRAEIAQALAADIFAFNVESAAELTVLADIAHGQGRRARVQLRVNPDVDAGTHPYISTGLAANKFGIAMADATALLAAWRNHAAIEIIGLDFHIGSQLASASPIADAIKRVAGLLAHARELGHPMRTLDIGGGLGVTYGKPGDLTPPPPADYAAAVLAALGEVSADVTLLCEPGRSIVAPAGALLTQVLYTKHNGAKHFTIVDAAMNDLLRPALYQAYHPIWPVRAQSPHAKLQVTDVVGPVCETADFFARDRELPVLAEGEMVAIGAAGAYGFVMASNYNTRPRAAEVMVTGNQFRIIRARETLDHLLAGEVS